MELKSILDIGGWIGTFFFGVISFLLYFFPARQKQLDEATTKLINTLQETVEALEKDLNIYKEKTLNLERHQAENITKIEKIEAENKTFREVLEGRDKATQKFYEECYKAMTTAEQTHTLMQDLITIVKANTEGIQKNNVLTDDFVKMMKEHFLNMEKKIL